MNLIRLFAIGTALVLSLPAIAQQPSTSSTQHPPSVDQHLKMLSEQLNLTADQQQKARPILKEMQDSIQKVMDNKTLTHEQMHEQMQPARMKADKELRSFLTDDQKKTLDELESHPHPESHGHE
jgi:Spy/CpxP family protein refolding chaperone